MRVVESWSEDLPIWKKSVWLGTWRGWMAAIMGQQKLHL